MISTPSIPIDNQGTPDPLGILPCGLITKNLPNPAWNGKIVGDGTFYPVGFTAEEIVHFYFNIKNIYISTNVNADIKVMGPLDDDNSYDIPNDPGKGDTDCPGGYSQTLKGNYTSPAIGRYAMNKVEDLVCTEKNQTLYYKGDFNDQSINYKVTPSSDCGGYVSNTNIDYNATNVFQIQCPIIYTNNLYYPYIAFYGPGWATYDNAYSKDYPNIPSITYNITCSFNTPYFNKTIFLITFLSLASPFEGTSTSGSINVQVNLSADQWDYSGT
jgi:hypothetical protein